MKFGKFRKQIINSCKNLGNFVQSYGENLNFSTYRGFLPYATFGTLEKVALAKNSISHVHITVLPLVGGQGGL